MDLRVREVPNLKRLAKNYIVIHKGTEDMAESIVFLRSTEMETDRGRSYRDITASGHLRVIMGDIGGDVHIHGNDGRFFGVSR